MSVMRNPNTVSDVLKRRLFMTGSPYTRRDAVGIMGSSAPLMEAVMRQGQQDPLLQLTGGRNSPRGGSSSPSPSLPLSTGGGFPDESDPNQGAGGQDITQPPVPEVEANLPPVTSKPKPSKSPSVTPPKPRPDVDDLPPATSGNLSQAALQEAMKKLIGNKSTDDFIKENRELLETYAPIPKKKNLRKQYLTKFFLDMAARGAMGDAPIEAGAKAAPGTFDEFLAADEKQRRTQAERDLLSVSMGLQDKKTQDAAAQAINLKILEIAADQPEKLKQVQALMDRGLTQEEALARVFPDAKPGATQMQMEAFKEMGHSTAIAALMMNAQLLKDANNNPSFFLNYLMDPQFATNSADANLLMSLATKAGAKMPDILAALAAAGTTLDAQGNVVPLGDS